MESLCFWAGYVELSGKRDRIEIDFNTNGASAARVDLNGMTERRVQVNFESSQIKFALNRGNHKIIFRGRIQGGIIEGAVAQNGTDGAFRLVSVPRVDPELRDSYRGTYRLGPDRFLFVGRDGVNLCIFDYSLGRFIGPLFPLSETVFYTTSPTRPHYAEIDLTVEFTRDGDGSVTGLIWGEKERPDIAAPKVTILVDWILDRMDVPGGPHPAGRRNKG